MLYSPFYRNHNVKATIGQEAYHWSSVSEAARRAIAVRYSMLTYMYTLFYYAHTKGETVMRALAWEFPNDETLRETYSQFLLGPSILVTPVLVPNVETVNGVFPGIGEGTRWYDWYTLQEVKASPTENVTLDAPLEHINVHVRGGSILPLQQPKYTTGETRNTPYSILVALDDNNEAEGSLYLDDGVSLHPNVTRLVQVSIALPCSPPHDSQLTANCSSLMLTTASPTLPMATTKPHNLLPTSPSLASRPRLTIMGASGVATTAANLSISLATTVTRSRTLMVWRHCTRMVC